MTAATNYKLQIANCKLQIQMCEAHGHGTVGLGVSAFPDQFKICNSQFAICNSSSAAREAEGRP
jgi:hypothetical protein